MLREDPKGRRLKKGSPGEKRVGNKGSGNRNKKRCETHLVRKGGGRRVWVSGVNSISHVLLSR